jgi:hypothetical protein
MNRLLGYILLTLIVVSCGTPSGQFKIEGRFKNFNQGEFYIYSSDETQGRLDTIHVADGRFAYTTYLDDTVTFQLVFPNFSEVPVFAMSGASVTINGDASHLKEIEITGTDDNELMTQFRLSTSELTPPETLVAAENFIKDHPESRISLYMLDHYFILNSNADYAKASELLKLIKETAPDNRQLKLLDRQLESFQSTMPKGKLPRFSATDMKGRQVSNAQLNAELNVIYLWATWNYDSQNMQRQLRSFKKDYGSRLSLLGISIDARRHDCERTVDRDSISWSTVNDGRMWQTPLLSKLGLAELPGNIVTDRSGRIVARNLSTQELRDKIKATLK